MICETRRVSRCLFTATLLIVFASPSFAGAPRVCPANEDLVKHLQDAGVSSSDAVRYASIFQHNDINLSILTGMAAKDFQSIGISAYEDCLNIVHYFNEDTNDCAGVKNPCKNGGICQDGFKCFSCHCEPDSYGKTCERKCPCHNNGRCRETSAGVECDCPVGFEGTLCENNWLTQQVISNLQGRVVALLARLSTAETKLEQNKKDIEAQSKLISNLTNEYSRNKWSFIRVDQSLNQLNKLRLHNSGPTFTQNLPIHLPQNTKAILISVFLNFWNGARSHAYLNFITYQSGNDKLGKVSVVNTHFDIYANTMYYELMLPWNTSLPAKIMFKVTSSYNTGGPNNWYTVKLVGYITA